MGKIEGLFIPDIDEDGLYVKWNIDLLPAICKQYKLSKIATYILLDISMYYEAYSQINQESTALKISYRELARRYGCNIKSVQSSIENLLEKGFI
jgi:hypothetical protein